MEIRKGTLKDLEAIAAVEAACFPAAEAATAGGFAGRVAEYGGHFWVAGEGGRLGRAGGERLRRQWRNRPCLCVWGGVGG